VSVIAIPVLWDEAIYIRLLRSCSLPCNDSLINITQRLLTQMDNMITTTKKLLFLIFIFTLNYFAMAQVSPSRADAIIGTWLMPDNEGIIEIFKDGEYYSGNIIWMQEKEEDGTPLKDKENPVYSLRKKTVEGLQVMSGFKYENNNLWNGGTFYAAKKGKEVEPEFILEDENHLNIEISIFIFSMTVELTRVDTVQFFQNINMDEK